MLLFVAVIGDVVVLLVLVLLRIFTVVMLLNKVLLWLLLPLADEVTCSWGIL